MMIEENNQESSSLQSKDEEQEAHFFNKTRKDAKIARKLISAKDRSKFKKTDWQKFKKSEELHKNIKLRKEDLLEGRVLSIVPEGVIVEQQQKLFTCTLRGLLKKDKSLYKNLITVGDTVLFELKNQEEGLIAHVQPRYSVLSRADNLSRRKEQLIAANIDQVLITASLFEPIVKSSLIDRYVIAARKGNMVPIIIINKIDLLESADLDADLLAKGLYLLEEMVKAYKTIGIPLLAVSSVTGQGIAELKAIMQNKASVFSGQSGVGKSSLINTVAEKSLQVGEIVSRTQKGCHTTTTTNLLSLSFGGWCIDTPGIKSFGVWDLKKEEIENYFSEIHHYGLQCKFPNCSHLHESDCAVQQALEKGELSLLRYESYATLIESTFQKHVRR